MDQNIMDFIQSQLTGAAIDQMSKKIGGNPLQTATAANGIISALLGGLTRNATSEQGASSLLSALDRDHDGSILDDAVGFLSGVNRPQNDRMTNGAGIINHILGNRQSGVMDMVGKISGLDQSKTGQLMMMLAPLVMGALGKQKRQQNLDQGGLSQLLQGSMRQPQAQNLQTDLIGRLLDSDGDGSVVDDVAGIGMKILGGLFSKK